MLLERILWVNFAHHAVCLGSGLGFSGSFTTSRQPWCLQVTKVVRSSSGAKQRKADAWGSKAQNESRTERCKFSTEIRETDPANNKFCDWRPFWAHKMKKRGYYNKHSVLCVYKKQYDVRSEAKLRPQTHFSKLQALKTHLWFFYVIMLLFPYFNCTDMRSKLHKFI